MPMKATCANETGGLELFLGAKAVRAQSHRPSSAAAAVGWKLALCLVCAAAIRLCYFTGLAIGDDVIYASEALATANTGEWYPAQNHWQTRAGVVLPVALCVRCLGPEPIAFVLWPLLASTASGLVCYLLSRHFAGLRLAWMAT